MVHHDQSSEEPSSERRHRPPLTVVLDTVGFVRALLKPYGPWGQILFEQSDSYELVVSDLLLSELDDVFKRPSLAAKYSMLPGRDMDAIRRRLDTGIFVRMLVVESVSRDPDDDYLIAMAIAGHASYLVTEDKDLLSLGTYKHVVFINGRHFLWMLGEIKQDSM